MKIGKTILSFLIFFLIALISYAQTNSDHVRVRGYYRSNGTYVQPHYRTAPNYTNRDNFSSLGNINPYTGQAGWIKPDNHVISERYNGWYTAKKVTTSKVCINTSCTHNSLIYSSGYYYKVANHCLSHIPKCSNPQCEEPRHIDYSGRSYQEYCDEHEHTCQTNNCFSIAHKDRYQTKYCNEHSPKCKNPSCGSVSKSISYGDSYIDYCSQHEHTCKEYACFNSSVKDRYQTKLCNEHSPKCKNPNCSRVSKSVSYGDSYIDYCSQHEHTCKEYDCFSLAVKDRYQTKLCDKHSPKCKNPNCNSISKSVSYGDSYIDYCSQHEHTCKEYGCFNIAVKDRYQTKLCKEHSNVCKNPNCNNTCKSVSYGDSYIDYCSQHEHTCKEFGCFNLAIKDRYQTKLCNQHSPKCKNPNCNSVSKSVSYGDSYIDYCSQHEHTCKEYSCFNLAIKDRYQTKLCHDHSPKCKNPNCGQVSKSVSYGDSYIDYCSQHEHTCKEYGCFNSSVKDRYQTKLCHDHSPKCKNPNCSRVSKSVSYGDSYIDFCLQHEHTCKEYGCFSLAVKDRYQTKLCNQHSPKCAENNCNRICKSRSYGDSYYSKCSVHQE